MTFKQDAILSIEKLVLLQLNCFTSKHKFLYKEKSREVQIILLISKLIIKYNYEF
jgi:hypothetical protein